MRESGRGYDLSDGFYPFDISLSNIFQGDDYTFSLMDNINVYDFSELFFYTITIPLILWGGLHVWKSLISNKLRLFSSIKNRLGENMKRYTTNQSMKISTREEQLPETPIGEKTKECITDETQSMEKKDIRPFPLCRRFVGSMIDKTIIVVLFVLGCIVYHPYAGTGELGYLMGLNQSSPSLYGYIDRELINNYGNYREGVDIDFQDKARLEEGEPYMGYTKDLEMRLLSIFIIINVFYYIIFEYFFRSSLGKLLMGGKLIDESNNIAFYWKVILRGVLLGAISLTIFLFIRYELELNYYWVVTIFFLILDVPLYFTKRSLIDISTNTKYVDTLSPEDFKGKYGLPIGNTKSIIIFLFLVPLLSCNNNPSGSDNKFDDCETCEGDGYIEIECDECDGRGVIYVDCNECNGTGRKECIRCYGKGRETCIYCSGNGRTRCTWCYGEGREECSSCGGLGKDSWNDSYCSSCNGRGSKQCYQCYGIGYQDCNSCNGRGYKDCSMCYGQGYEDCNECNGLGNLKVECERCNGYGKLKLICEDCDGEGEIAQ